MRVRSALISCLMFAGPLFATPGADYPSRPIKLIVPYPAGGPTDMLGRLIADYLARDLKQSVFVENKGGAQGAVQRQWSIPNQTATRCCSRPVPSSCSIRCCTKSSPTIRNGISGCWRS